VFQYFVAHLNQVPLGLEGGVAHPGDPDKVAAIHLRTEQ